MAAASHAAEWISAADAPAVDAAVKATRRAPDGTSWFCSSVTNDAAVKRAVWRVTALGVFDAYVNGRRVGDDFLKPGYTHPRKLRYRYDYDVTALLRTEAGAVNALAAEVSHGWWSDNIAGYPGRKPAFRGELEVECADGTRRVYGTDRTHWRAGVGGPVVHAGIYDGETCDARIAAPLFGSASFGAPEANVEFSGEIRPVAGAKIGLRRDLALKANRLPLRLAPGVTNVVDFGQNCTAVPFFRFRARRGTKLTALPAEVLNPTGDGAMGDDGAKGTIHRKNLRHPEIGMCVDYTFRGDGTEEYHPRFTFFGYRYLGLVATDEVVVESLESVPVSSVTREMETAEIEVGDPMLNRFIENVRWGELSNFLSVPMDCPQRDERLGWTGDAQVFAETALYNADLGSFFRKWMRDVRDCQTATGAYAGVAPPGMLGDTPMRIGYSDAGIIVPYRVWTMTGDTRILAENFESMDRYLRHVDETRYAHAAVRDECENYQFADWLSFERYESFDLAWGGDRNGKFELTEEIVRYWDYLGGCYWLMDAQMMSEMARALGRDAAPYEAMAASAREYLRKSFIEADGLVVRAWRDMQTPLLFALHLGLVQGEAKAQTVELLKRNFAAHDGRLQTGFLGTSILMDTLVEVGLTDLAYDLLFKRGCPGWLHAVENGATTVWERWNGWTPEKGFNVWYMNSFNHYAYGSVVAWIWKNTVGIAADPSVPGFRRILMVPKPDRRVGSVRASYRSAAGLVESSWRYEGDDWIWEFAIPDGATALVTPPGETSSRVYGAGRHTLRQKGCRATKWISPAGRGAPLATAELRRETVNAKRVAKAVWKTSGLGVYEARVNGRVVSGFLEPGFTDVLKCRHEFIHDVTDAFNLDAGATNRLAASVSTGWWCDMLERGNSWAHRKDRPDGDRARPAFRGELILTAADGTEERVVTDERWLAAWGGETRLAGIWEGEDCDFRKRGCEAFAPAVANVDFTGELRPARNLPAVLRRDLALPVRTVCVWKGAEGAEGTNVFGRAVVRRRYAAGEEMRLEPGETLVADFGQNAAFVPEIVLSGEVGATVTMRPGEMLNDGNGLRSRGNDGPGGSVYSANYREARSLARVTLAGGGDERYSPRFTFFGGRYLSVEATAPVWIHSLVSVPVSSIGKEDERGTLTTGNALVNRLIGNVEWGLRSNYLSVPTDCPQRDERLGWTADTDVFAKTAMYCADVKDFLSKYLADLRDGADGCGVYPMVAPRTFVGCAGFKFGWTDAGVLLTHKLWWRYGDRRIVDENWESMVRYVRHVESFGGRTEVGKGWQFGDWLSFEKYEAHQDSKTDPKGFEDWWNYLGGCYLLMDEEALADMAAWTGRTDERREFQTKAEVTRNRLRSSYFGADGEIDARYRDLQCAHVFALKCRLVEGPARQRSLDRLVGLIESNGNRLATGFLGTGFLLDALSENGRADVAYTLLLQTDCPSWLFPVMQGATTSWERWNSYTKKDGFADVNMNSFNHYAYGCVLGWLYETAAGIRPAEPGYAKVTVDPKPDPRLGSLSARFVTPKGETVTVDWRYDSKGACRVVKKVSATASVPVWPAGRETEMNGFYRFRADVISGAATNGVLKATAGYAYRAKVNGRFVGYGPARSAPGFFRLDEWPVALAAGTNAVELEVAGYNCNNFYLPDQTPFVQAEVRVGDRVLARTAGDGAFSACEAGRVRKAPRFCYQRGFAEIYRLPETRTAALPLAEQPAKKLLPREWAYPDFHLTAPFAAVSTETVARDGSVKPATPRCLVRSTPGYKIFPLGELEENPHYDLPRLKTVSRRKGALVRNGWHPLSANGGVVFEAPREYAGFPRFRARCRAPVTLYFTFDEFLQPDGSVDNFRAETLGAAVWHLAPGEYELEGFEPVALKCARILAVGGAVEVTAPSVRTFVSPAADRASFRASDPAYGKIFEAAKASYAANAVDCLTDCPIRERAGWLGDSFFTGRASQWLTGAGKNERLFLDNFLRPEAFGGAPEFAGLLPAVWPCDLMTTDCFIPNYDMWFVLELEEHVRRTGDGSLAAAFRPRVLGMIGALDRHLNSDGLLERLPGWVFVEWSHANQLVRDVNYPSNMMYAEALSAAARLYGLPALAERAAKMRETVRRQSLTADGWYCDNAIRQKDGSLKPSGERTEVCQYYAFFTGVATKARDATLWNRLVRDFGPERIRNAKWEDGGNLWMRLSTPIREGVWKEIWPANMIFGTCLRMELLSRDGRSAQVAREMKGHFLPMAEKTGTLWEHGDPRASCCHGFAAIAAEYLYRDVLGVREIDARAKAVRVEPPVGVPLDWCEGDLPLPDGGVASIRWEKSKNGPVAEVSLPRGWIRRTRSSLLPEDASRATPTTCGRSATR